MTKLRDAELREALRKEFSEAVQRAYNLDPPATSDTLTLDMKHMAGAMFFDRLEDDRPENFNNIKTPRDAQVYVDAYIENLAVRESMDGRLTGDPAMDGARLVLQDDKFENLLITET